LKGTGKAVEGPRAIWVRCWAEIKNLAEKGSCFVEEINISILVVTVYKGKGNVVK
jgi:hypothetical protein